MVIDRLYGIFNCSKMVQCIIHRKIGSGGGVGAECLPMDAEVPDKSASLIRLGHVK